jgi:hypothetical protein
MLLEATGTSTPASAKADLGYRTSFAEMFHLYDPDSSDDDVGAADEGGDDLDSSVSATHPLRNLFVLRAFAVIVIMYLLVGTLGLGYVSMRSHALSNGAKSSVRYSTNPPVRMQPRRRHKLTKRKGSAAPKPLSRQTSKKKQKSTAKTPAGAEASRTWRKSEL